MYLKNYSWHSYCRLSLPPPAWTAPGWRWARTSAAECGARQCADVPSKRGIPADTRSAFLGRKNVIRVIFGNKKYWQIRQVSNAAQLCSTWNPPGKAEPSEAPPEEPGASAPTQHSEGTVSCTTPRCRAGTEQGMPLTTATHQGNPEHPALSRAALNHFLEQMPTNRFF